MSCSWDLVRNQVRQFRTNIQSIYPIQVLSLIKDFTIHNNVLYFLSNNLAPVDLPSCRRVFIYQIELKQFDYFYSILDQEKNYLTAASKLPVLDKTLVFSEYLFQDTVLPIGGVTSMSIGKEVIMFTFNDHIYISQIGKIPTLIPFKASTPIRSGSSPMEKPDQVIRADPKLGNDNKISFIRNNDIWISDYDGNERQLTFCCLKADTSLKCGVAEYMMQEEFHRFTGYYWNPKGNSILYLETSEKDVEIIHLSKPSSSDYIRYPRAGQPNVKSTLKLVEFEKDIVHKQLWNNNHLKHQFPWMEYITRFGWLPDGQSIWLQILSRDQKRSALLQLYPQQFTTTSTTVIGNYTTEIIWEETSQFWINITDVFYFLSTSSLNVVKLIWSSEQLNGHRHLYYIEKYNDQPSTTRQITYGNWSCIDRPIYVDELRNLVYFSAKKDTPLESHFYVASITMDLHDPIRLTKLGYNHNVTMDSPDHFTDCFSTLCDPQVTMIQKINHLDHKLSPAALILPVLLKDALPSPDFVSTELTTLNDMIPNGEIFNFTTHDGILLYGYLYKPRHYDPNKSYPTVLHIYGGPKTQLVTNEFKFPRLMRYLMSAYFGFAVVVIDSRGSSDRGLNFESHIQHKLGMVELNDQIEGLKFIHDTKLGGQSKSVIDLDRVAITGWSYGGYLSLMALAQYSDFFKMSIAGAPVTKWELYDAAYTERYMGLPKEHADAYHCSNILTHIEKFPNTENRLLIAHGLIDENVHYKNTELLVSQLTKHNKPHYLQVYPSEKHGLRHASVNEHFETLMFYWLSNYL
ncbi:hypothetical protein HPULCUR_003916 [Helicostylum pulchrum]|uniref:Uncharacterized protein n=1 Tax=Helicostylum pulchrum TaxID=562976 RepID=A0ABP9XUS8_9FUNG